MSMGTSSNKSLGDETDSFPSSNSSLYCDPKEKLIHSQATILAPSQVLAALETTT